MENGELLLPGLAGLPLDTPWFLGDRVLRSSEFSRPARNLGVTCICV